MELTVYLNGRLIPESQASLSIWDRGFTLGDAVYDSFRTFQHRPFRLDEHLARLYRSLRYVSIDPGLDQTALKGVVEETLAVNLPQVNSGDDVILKVRVSRGVPGEGPTVLVTCRPIEFGRFAPLYKSGVDLITPTVRAVSRESLDPRIKTQSRIVNVLAEMQAQAARPGAWPLLCNRRGIITESARSNFLMVQDGLILTPKGGRVLAGVTAAVTTDLAEKAGYRVEERDLTPYDVMLANEAFLTSTSMCVMPVRTLNGTPINGGRVPGRVTAQLMDAWQELTRVDFMEQAREFGDREKKVVSFSY